jgi:hypothetical protein
MREEYANIACTIHVDLFNDSHIEIVLLDKCIMPGENERVM